MAGATGPNPGETNTTPSSQTPLAEVYGTAASGSVPAWNATTGRFEWMAPSGTYAPILEAVNTVAASGTAVTLPDVTTATMHKLTLTGNCTVTLPAPAAGKSLTIEVNQDATGSRTLAFATPSGAVQWAGGTAPTWTSAASKRDVVTFVCIGGTNWIGSALLDVR